MGWDSLHLSDLCSYILICIITNQSGQLYNDQSECMILTSQDSVIWTNQTVQICIIHLHKNGPIRDQVRYFLYIIRSPIGLWGAPFWFPLGKAVFPVLQTVHLSKISPSLHPRVGTPFGNGLLVAAFCWQKIGNKSAFPKHLVIHALIIVRN